MNVLPSLAHAPFRNFFDSEWDEKAGVFAFKSQEGPVIVVRHDVRDRRSGWTGRCTIETP